MFRIPYTSCDLPPSVAAAFDAEGVLETTWDELLHAALSIGRPNTADVFRHESAAFHETLFRLSQVRMAVEEDHASRTLRQTRLFRCLDATEQAATGYFLAMTLCRLFAGRVKAPWMLHVCALRGVAPEVLASRARPDLVGQAPDLGWYAFRCAPAWVGPDTEAALDAMERAPWAGAVDGADFALRAVAICYFQGDALAFYWQGEKALSRTPERVDMRLPDDCWRYYYEPALSLLGETAGSTILSGGYRVMDVGVETAAGMHELLLERSWAEARDYALWRGSDDLAANGLQPDGLRVAAGTTWRSARERDA